MQLIVNAGSSSLKWALYTSPRSRSPHIQGMFDRLGDECLFHFGHRSHPAKVHDHFAAFSFLHTFLRHNNILSKPITSTVHRVVHGGEKYSRAVLIDDKVLADISSLSVLAPLHNPANLSGIRAAMKSFPAAKIVSVFDTAFHHTIHPEAFRYAIPDSLYHKYGIRKYGFHGISHSYIAHWLRHKYGVHPHAISAHLGSGSSITALSNGHSVDTTMGFTPLDGVVMSTRSGGIDPEIPLFLQRVAHMSLDEVEDMLQHHSGLEGLTGSSDLRDIHAQASNGNAQAKLALSILSYRIAWYVNALRTAVPDFSVLVFTAGIGENAWYVRKQVCDFLKISLDHNANKLNSELISADDSPVAVHVVKTDEQDQMHREASRLLL